MPHYYKIFRYKPVCPYNLDMTLQTWAKWNESYKYYDGQTSSQTFEYRGKPLLLLVSQSHNKKLTFKVISKFKFDKKDYAIIKKKILHLLNLDINLNYFYAHVRQSNDTVMKCFVKNLKGLSITRIGTLFETFIVTILSQQISTVVGIGFITKFYQLLGKKFKIENKTYYVFPTPKKVYSMPKRWFVKLGLTNKRAEYVRDVAKKFLTGELDENLLSTMDSEDLRETLLNIRGIGSWSANMIMLRGFGRVDAIPDKDLDLIRGMKKYYGVRTNKGIQKIVEKWGNWKGLAWIYLITAIHAELKC